MACLCYSLFFTLLLFVLIQDDFHLIPFFPHKIPPHKPRARYDYAASDPGGKIVGHSREIYGARGILKPDKDKYLLVPCSQVEKWVEISLLEDILIDEVQFIQGEIYSSSFKAVELQYSIEFPSESWQHLITIELEPGNSAQKFKVDNVWVRFLKLVFLSYYGSEYYCTLSQFSVYGSTILQNLSEDYLKQREETNAAVKNLTLDDDNSEKFLEEGDYFYEYQQMTNGLANSSMCRPVLYSYNFTCDNKENRLEVFEKDKELKVYFNVFGEMVKHLSKTELKIEQLMHFCTRMEKGQKNFDEKLKLIDKHLTVLELQVLEKRLSIENLQFWMIFFIILIFITMLLAIYVKRKREKSILIEANLIRRGSSSSADENLDSQTRKNGLKTLQKKHTK